MTTWEFPFRVFGRVIGGIILVTVITPIIICSNIFNNEEVYNCKFCNIGACNCKSVKTPCRIGGKSSSREARCYDKNGNILDGIYEYQ